MNIYNSKTYKMLKIALIFFCTFSSVLLLYIPLVENNTGNNKSSDILLTDGWTVFSDGKEEGESVSLPYRVINEDVSQIDLFITLPETNFELPTISFTAFQKNIYVYIDNQLVFQNVFKPTPLNKEHPGSGTCLFSFSKDSAGKELRIQMNRIVKSDKGPLSLVKLYDGAPTPQSIAPVNKIIFVLMVSILFIGIILIIVLMLYKSLGLYLLPLSYLSLAVISFASWTLCNTKMIEIFVDNWVFVHNLEYLSFYIMPYAILAFIRYNWENSTKAIKVMNYIMLSFFAFSLFIRIFLNIDLFELLTIFHILIVATLVVYVREMIINRKKKSQSYKMMLIGAIVLCVSSAFEISRFYVFYNIIISDTAVYFIIGLAAFSVCLILSFLLSTKERIYESFALITKKNRDAEHNRYEILISNTKDIFMDWNIIEDTVYFSYQFESYFGIPPYTNNVIKNNKEIFKSAHYSRDLDEMYYLILNGSEEERVECRFLNKDGEEKWFNLSLTPAFTSDKNPEHIIGIIHDITNEKIMEEEYLNQRQYMQMSDEMFDNILEADITENKLIGKNSAELIISLGMEDDATYSEVITTITKQITHEDFADNYAEMMSRERILSLFESNISSFEFECRELNDASEYKWIRLTVRIFKSYLTDTIRIISYVKDIEEEKQREFKLLNSSLLDAFTGTLNKSATKEYISEFLNGDAQGYTHAFLMVDIDKFKNINDTLGHAVGDMIIQNIAHKLTAHFDSTDIVGRVGGDEFVVMFKNFQNIELIEKKCQALCKDIYALEIHDNQICNVSISIGVSLYPQHGIKYDQLYRNADIALYAAKENGRNTFCIFSDELIK